MKKLLLVLVAALPLLATLGPAPASAQTLEAGTWTGRVTEPDGDGLDVTFAVAIKGDTISIAVTAGQHGTFPFSDVKLNDRTLTFNWSPGVRVDCTLTRRDDGAYEGPCKDAQGSEGRILMVPPKKG